MSPKLNLNPNTIKTIAIKLLCCARITRLSHLNETLEKKILKGVCV